MTDHTEKAAAGEMASSWEEQNSILDLERRVNSPWRKLMRNKTAVVGLVIVVLICLLAVFAPLLTPFKVNSISVTQAYWAPGRGGHVFGTDEYGRDLFTRIAYGARISMFVAVGGTVVGAAIGVLLGLFSGFRGGFADSVIMRLMDAMMAFPFVLLSIILMTVLGSGVLNVILAIGIANVPNFARIVRGQVHIVKNEEYCNAERALGASDARILFMHILGNSISPTIVYFTLNIASSIISEAALSFLGLGITPPTPSWGNILSEGRNCLNTSPHIATISGLFILITVLGFNLLGDGIRDVMDPKMKR